MGLRDWLRKRTVTHYPLGLGDRRVLRVRDYRLPCDKHRSRLYTCTHTHTHTPARRFGPARALRAAADSRPPSHARRDGQSVVTVRNARVGCAALRRPPATHARHTRARFRLLDAGTDRNARSSDFGCGRCAAEDPWIARSGREATAVRPRLMRPASETAHGTRGAHGSSRTRRGRLLRDGKSKTISIRVHAFRPWWVASRFDEAGFRDDSTVLVDS